MGELLGKFSLNISAKFCRENIKANTFLQTVGDVRLHCIPVTQKMQKDDKGLKKSKWLFVFCFLYDSSLFFKWKSISFGGNYQLLAQQSRCFYYICAMHTSLKV